MSDDTATLSYETVTLSRHFGTTVKIQPSTVAAVTISLAKQTTDKYATPPPPPPPPPQWLDNLFLPAIHCLPTAVLTAGNRLQTGNRNRKLEFQWHVTGRECLTIISTSKSLVCTSRAQENCTGLGMAVLKYHQGRNTGGCMDGCAADHSAGCGTPL